MPRNSRIVILSAAKVSLKIVILSKARRQPSAARDLLFKFFILSEVKVLLRIVILSAAKDLLFPRE
jgi:hypothetical protein